MLFRSALVPSRRRAAGASRGSPCSPRYAPGPGVPRDRLRGLPGLRSNSVASGCAAAGCRARPACRARRFRCVCDGRDRLARVRPRTGPAVLPRCVPRCVRVRSRSPPYPHRPCRLGAAAAPVASGDGRQPARRRPAVTGWVYGGDRALTSRFTPALVCQGCRRRRAAPDGVRREGAARAPR